MKYEKYLITEDYRIDEAMTPEKNLKKLRDKIVNAKTAVEVRLAGAMLVTFLKKFGKSPVWNDKTSKEITDALSAAKARVK